jgi:NADH dehydrogenase
MSDIKSILVVGATGTLGEPVARRLQTDGFRVSVLARSPDRAKRRLGDSYQIVQGDVERPDTLGPAVQGCYGVYINLNGDADPASHDRIVHRGTANLAHAAVSAGVERLHMITGASVSEENAWFYATEAKLQAEAAIRASGVPYSIWRATWFMESLPLFVRGNKAVLMGKQPHLWSWLAVEDYARMVSTAFRMPEAANKIFYVHGPEGLTMRRALEFYCSRVRPGVRVSAVPLWFLSLMARVTRNDTMRSTVGLMRYFEKVPEQGDPTEANALLGVPATTLAEWCRKQNT